HIKMPNLKYQSKLACVSISCPSPIMGFMECHSALMLAARITLPHLSVSSVRSIPKSADDPENTEASSAASCDFIVGSARNALISLFRLSTISTGVPLGAPTPFHELAS